MTTPKVVAPKQTKRGHTLEKVTAILKRKYKNDRLILDKLEPKDRHAVDEAWHELCAS
jgi:hypothetical protein